MSNKTQGRRGQQAKPASPKSPQARKQIHPTKTKAPAFKKRAASILSRIGNQGADHGAF